METTSSHESTGPRFLGVLVMIQRMYSVRDHLSDGLSSFGFHCMYVLCYSDYIGPLRRKDPLDYHKTVLFFQVPVQTEKV